MLDYVAPRKVAIDRPENSLTAKDNDDGNNDNVDDDYDD